MEQDQNAQEAQDEAEARREEAALATTRARLNPGLTLAATPLGAAGDVTLRTLAALREADILLAEDTRRLRKLMDIHGIPLGGRPLWRCDSHREAEAAAQLLPRLAAGAKAVFASDAGTPGISDPGARLALAVLEGGGALSALPGPSAAILALTLSGLPTERFFFAGFPPAKSGDRRRLFESLAAVPGTLIFYEAPHRLPESLADMAASLGPRPAAVARELTKLHEELRRGSLTELAAHYAESGPPKGELVVMAGPPPEKIAEADPAAVEAALASALEAGESVRDAAAAVAEAMGLPRKQVYAQALEIRKAWRT